MLKTDSEPDIPLVDHILEQYFYALNGLHTWTIAVGYIGLHT